MAHLLVGVAAAFLIGAVWANDARPARSAAARSSFHASNPCPATSNTRGPCPGWEVDHITPLKCGGPDAPENMQWLTVEQHRAKTKAEAKLCRPKKK